MKRQPKSRILTCVGSTLLMSQSYLTRAQAPGPFDCLVDIPTGRCCGETGQVLHCDNGEGTVCVVLERYCDRDFRVQTSTQGKKDMGIICGHVIEITRECREPEGGGPEECVTTSSRTWALEGTKATGFDCGPPPSPESSTSWIRCSEDSPNAAAV